LVAKIIKQFCEHNGLEKKKKKGTEWAISLAKWTNFIFEAVDNQSSIEDYFKLSVMLQYNFDH